MSGTPDRPVSERLEELRKLREAATPGPWVRQGSGGGPQLLHGPDYGGIDIGPLFGWHDMAAEDAAFMVEAANCWDALMDVVEAAAEMKDDWWDGPAPVSYAKLLAALDRLNAQ